MRPQPGSPEHKTLLDLVEVFSLWSLGSAHESLGVAFSRAIADAIEPWASDEAAFIRFRKSDTLSILNKLQIL